MTTEHLRPLLDQSRDSHNLFVMAERMARAEAPPSVNDAIRLGRLTALQKPRGAVRGIVAGDILRWLVSHTMSQQLSKAVGSGNGAFPVCDDHKSRNRMHCPRFASSDGSGSSVHLDFYRWNRGIRPHFSGRNVGCIKGSCRSCRGSQALPFVRLFYGQPSQYLWADDTGTVHHADQGEGGEQGDALMPLLFSLGQHRALQAVQRQLAEGERLFVFHDSVYVTTPSPTGWAPSTAFWTLNCIVTP